MKAELPKSATIYACVGKNGKGIQKHGSARIHPRLVLTREDVYINPSITLAHSSHNLRGLLDLTVATEMVGSRLCLEKSTQLVDVCVRNPDLFRVPGFKIGWAVTRMG
jgi:hypothetical protein